MYRFVFDLDGTLANFDASGGFEKMHNQGFFQSLVPYPNGLELVQALYETGSEIFVLTACIATPYCKPEKMAWIEQHLPFVKKENIILIEVGGNKAAEFIRATESLIEENDFLFDDYGKNLKDWYEAGGTPIKCGKTYKKEREYKQLIKFKNINKIFAL